MDERSNVRHWKSETRDGESSNEAMQMVQAEGEVSGDG